MKKLILDDDSILESEIGFDSINGWSIPKNVKEVEFEDGTIFKNPNFVETEKNGG